MSEKPEINEAGRTCGLAVAPCSASTIFVLFVNTVVTVVLICAQASVDWAHAMMQFGGVLIGVSYGMFFARHLLSTHRPSPNPKVSHAHPEKGQCHERR